MRAISSGILLASLVLSSFGSLVPIPDCYLGSSTLSMDIHVNQICATVTPTGSLGCGILPSMVVITANLSAYPTTLVSYMTDFSYMTTRKICTSCPLIKDVPDPACLSSFRLTTAASFAISTLTHEVRIFVKEMALAILEVSNCYNINTAVLYGDFAALNVCALMQPTGECKVVPVNAVQTLYVNTSMANLSFTLKGDYNASERQLCYTVSPTDYAVLGALAAGLSDPWVIGNFTLAYTINSVPYLTNVELTTFVTSFLFGCLVSANITVSPSFLVVTIQTSGDAKACTVSPDAYGYLQPSVYLNVPETKMKVSASFATQLFNLTTNHTLVFPCGTNISTGPTSSLADCAALFQTVSSKANTAWGVFALNFRFENGSLIRPARIKAMSIHSQIFPLGHIRIEDGGLSVVIESDVSKVDTDGQLPTAALPYLMTVTLSTWNVTDPSQLLVRKLVISQNVTWSPNMSSVHFSCANANNMTVKQCMAMLLTVYAQRASYIASVNWLSHGLVNDLEQANYTTMLLTFRNGYYKHTINVAVGIGFGLTVPMLLAIAAYAFDILHRNIAFNAFLRGKLEKMSSDVSSQYSR